MLKVSVAVEGWNAEAAIGLALAAKKFASSVTLSSSRETVDGKDQIEVMTLGPEAGEEVVMAVEGKDEKEAFSALLARLLFVIEPRIDRLAAVTGTGTARQDRRQQRTGVIVTGFAGTRIADIAALEVEEVAPARPRKLRQAQDQRRRQYSKSGKPRKRQKPARRKPVRTAGRKPTTTKRKPRKRKK